jgi:hypothetical protein
MARTSRMLSVTLGLMGLSFCLIFAVAVGCQDAGIGRPCCTVGPGAGTDCVNSPEMDPMAKAMAGSGLSDNDLKCATRICAYVQPQACSNNPGSDECASALGNTKAECTDSCKEDGDCPEGFLCATPVIVGRTCCRKVCVRAAYVPKDPGTGKPIAVPDQCKPNAQNHQTCPNVPVSAEE